MVIELRNRIEEHCENFKKKKKEEYKKYKSELENTMPEIKNTLEGINSTLANRLGNIDA